MTITTAARRGRGATAPGALGNCVRCFEPTPATTTETLTFGGDEYRWELCETHAGMFQRDIYGWTRLGTIVEDDDFATFQRPRSDDSARRGQVVAAHVHVPVARSQPQAPPAPTPPPAPMPSRPLPGSPVQRGELSFAERLAQATPGALPEGFHKWTFSDHALARQEARGVSRAEALWCAAEPDIVHPGTRPNTLVHKKGHVETVVNPHFKRIITVINRSITKEEEDAHAAS